MIKEQEAGLKKRAFKVLPRRHIGYLVRYVTSNIYRIWVPILKRVIITRNVTFNEEVRYSKELEGKEGQPIPIARDVVELIEEDEIQDAGSLIEHLGLDGEIGRKEQREVAIDEGSIEQETRTPASKA